MIRINKTARREGFHQTPIPKSGVPKRSAIIGGQIPKKIGPIPKGKSLKSYGYYGKGQVF